MTTDTSALKATDPGLRGSGLRPAPRDPRVDLLRGLALITIFIDHIPYNSLSRFTLRSYGLSDAAEIFVFLAGTSALTAYGPVFEREGSRVGWAKIGRRCLTIWAAHGLLLTGSFAVLMLRRCFREQPLPCLGPFLQAGLAGLGRGLTLQGLPTYLDILPLYIVLLAGFPLVLFGLRRNVGVTLAASLALHALAVRQGWNLPSRIDARAAATVWTFNPLAWQSVFVLGAAMAQGRRQGWGWLSEPPRWLTRTCIGVLIFGVLAVDPWNGWPGLAEALFPRAALDDAWKASAPPWRLLHCLALLTLLLGSARFARLAAWPGMAAVRACGRYSLPVFSAGCMLALLSRIAFMDLGPTPPVQIAVNILGITAQLLFASWLRERSWRPAPPRPVATASLPEVPA